MFSYGHIFEPTGHRGDIEQPCGPPSGESVWRFHNRTDRQQVDVQLLILIFAERYSHDLDNLTPFSFPAQESGARISEVESPGKVLDMMPQIAFSLCHSLRCLIRLTFPGIPVGERVGYSGSHIGGMFRNRISFGPFWSQMAYDFLCTSPKLGLFFRRSYFFFVVLYIDLN